MSITKKIRRVLYVCGWIGAGAVVVVLLIAAMHSRSEQVCKGVEITLRESEKTKPFLSKSDIITVITANRTTTLKNKPVKSIDLNKIEGRLRKEVWIQDAQLYFDNKGMLKIEVTQREPVARVFTAGGQSFYIDSNCKKLPLSARSSVKLPVFTGYPFNSRKAQPGERKLLAQMKDLSVFLINDSFWMAQVAQIDISPSREFELVPTVGDHVVEFGTAENKEQKFDRLMVFYKQVLAKAGMNKYERIKVQYEHQVVGVKKEDNN
jgi:cell division protein FtsQ